jgi:preprotein translocase subunit SecG
LIEIVVSSLLTVASLMMIVLVLLHKGKGGGLSDMFGGGVSSSMGGSSVVERNLDRITIFTGILWICCIVALGPRAQDLTALGHRRTSPRNPSTPFRPLRPRPVRGDSRGKWQRHPWQPSRLRTHG